MPEQDKEKSPDVNGYYKIEVRENNVFISIFAPQGRGERVRYQTVVEDLRNREIKNYDKDLLKRAVSEHSGQEIIIGKHFPKDAEIQVDITREGLNAIVKVLPPAPGGAHITKEMLKKALTDANVIFGVKENVLDEIAEQRRYEEVILVAEGIPVKNGEDSRIEYKVDINKEKPKFKVNEDTGAVDLKEMNLIENVVEQQLLAVKIPAKQGEPGITVENKHIPPRPGRDLPIPAGKNTKVSDNGLELYSTINGMVSIVAGKINVDNDYNVKGDVSTATGNINFVGNVIVHGAVQDGYKVRAEGNIEVKQTVGKAILEAEGDIIVNQGIVGHNEAIIKAGGNVRAKYIQEANVKATGDILVSEAIMHSNVEAGERVILYGKKALIVGGNVIAYKEINARTIGSEMSTKTNVEVGVRPAMREELNKVEEDLAKDKKNLEQVEQGLTTLLKLKKAKQQLPPDKEKLLIQLAGIREGLKKKVSDLIARFDELHETLKTRIPSKICISGDAYPGVKITIRNITMFTTKKFTYSTFFEEAGEIKTRTYDEPRIDKKDLQ
ncbi:MAG: FapA family protein [Candidatus Hydrogenedentota bacterium]